MQEKRLLSKMPFRLYVIYIMTNLTAFSDAFYIIRGDKYPPNYFFNARANDRENDKLR